MKEYKIKYIAIGEELSEQILSGKYLPGERFYSRKQLCNLFRISEVTAVKVQNYLEERGLLRKQRGSGSFVNHIVPIKRKAGGHTPVSLQKVIAIQEKNESGFLDEFEHGIDFEIAATGIDYELQTIRAVNISLQKVNAISGMPGVGYIVMASGPESIFYSAVLLLNPEVNTVFVDAPILGSHCVLSDSYDGMRQIVEYLVGQGCERFIFAENCMRHPEAFYSSERRDAAVAHCRLHGKECLALSSGNYQDIFEALDSFGNKKCAVMFPQDDHALRFQKLVLSKNIKMPIVTGYDDYAPYMNGLEKLTTLRVDREEMGRQAVRLLLEPFSLSKKIIRIPGKLIIRGK